MKELELKPIEIVHSDYEQIELIIQKLFRDHIYLPLVKELGEGPKSLQNANDDLARSLAKGKIRYYRGAFSGKFNSTLTRELKRLGAKWDRRQGVFKIPLGSLPTELRVAITLSEDRFARVVEKINKMIGNILPEKISEQFKIEKRFDTMIMKLDDKIQSGMKGLAVSPKLSDRARDKIATDYTTNLRKYISDFTVKEIVSLRERIEKNVLTGGRYEEMMKTIQHSYGVSQNKAKFLARQETNLMMAKFKESRYQDAGINEYIWRCVPGSKNHPVRPMHKALDGTRQRFDKPPITDEKGQRNNPGEDYNCRCYARPIVSFK